MMERDPRVNPQRLGQKTEIWQVVLTNHGISPVTDNLILGNNIQIILCGRAPQNI